MLCNYTTEVQRLAASLNQHRVALPFPTHGFDNFGVALTALFQIAQASTDYQSRKSLIWLGPGFLGLMAAMSTSTPKSKPSNEYSGLRMRSSTPGLACMSSIL